MFEGEYENKKKNGIGLEYSKGRIIFKGNYRNNKRNEKGIEYTKGIDYIFGIGYKIGIEGFFING